MANRPSPDSIDPFILAYAAKLWTLAGGVLAATGMVAIFWTAAAANWRVALIPLVIFLPATGLAFWQRMRLRQGKSTPEAVGIRAQRTLRCEIIRLVLWLIALLIFLLWGLSGGWSLAWLVFVVAGVLEWLLDRLFAGRGCS